MTQEMKLDHDLVRRCRNGETDCFAVLIERYQVMLRSLIHRLVDDDETAEELAHDAFVRAWEKLDQFQGDSRFSTWLGQIGLNLARDHLRRRLRRPSESLSEVPADRLVYEPAGSLDEELDRQRWSQWLEQAMARLQPDEREILSQIYLLEQDYATVAQQLNCSRGAAQVRSFRARQSLRANMSDMAVCARVA